jgi:hypothetical protein
MSEPNLSCQFTNHLRRKMFPMENILLKNDFFFFFFMSENVSKKKKKKKNVLCRKSHEFIFLFTRIKL